MARNTAEETKEALVAAVIRLLDRRSVAEVTVKEIAAEAGVNHGLVHRYFGSKEALVREAIVRTNARISEGVPRRGRTSWYAEQLRQRPEIARILARCCMDGPHDLLGLAAPPRQMLEECIEPIRAALEKLGLAEEIDPYVLNALGVSTMLGWFVFGPLLEAGFGLPPGAEAQAQRLAEMIDSMVDAHEEDAS